MVKSEKTHHCTTQPASLQISDFPLIQVVKYRSELREKYFETKIFVIFYSCWQIFVWQNQRFSLKTDSGSQHPDMKYRKPSVEKAGGWECSLYSILYTEQRMLNVDCGTLNQYIVKLYYIKECFNLKYSYIYNPGFKTRIGELNETLP